MNHRQVRILGGVLLAVTALRVSPPFARAGDPSEAATPPRLVVSARKAEEGDLKASLAALITVEPRISNASVGLRADQDYALRIAARIVARSEKPPIEGFPSDEEQIKWAYLQARKLKDATPTASLIGDFGEIASRVPSERLSAFKALEELEAKNTMPSSFGYAALARMRDQAGNDTAKLVGAPLRALAAGKRQIALLRCHKVAEPIARAAASACDKGFAL